MTKTETALLLAQIAAFDHRTVGETDVEAWHAALDDTDYGDAQQAVIQHYRESTEWLMAAHIRAAVHRLRANRLALAGPEPAPDVDPDDVLAYQRALRVQRAQVAADRCLAQIGGGEASGE